MRPGEPVVVLLSGGRDSVCLLHVCAAVAGPSSVRALHVNYGLRGAASLADEAACAELCERLGVGLRRVRPVGRTPGNLQAWARAERYRAARELAAGANIAVGHTADDQAETIVYRLISSPSRRAVAGMRARDRDVVRPLLGVPRSETTAYCERHGLGWREDASNESGAYVRNRIRHEVLPLLRQLHPGADGNLLALAEQLRAETAVLDGLVDAELHGGDAVALARLRALPPALAALVIQRLADGAAGGPAPGTARRTAEILALSDHAALDLPHGVRAEVRRGVVRFVPTPPR